MTAPVSAAEPVIFIVSGQEQSVTGASRGGAATTPIDPQFDGGTVKQSVRVGAQRGGQDVHMAAIPGEDVVVLEIAGGPTLTLHPHTARELMMAQGPAAAPARGGYDTGTTSTADTTVRVPVQLQWRGLEAGEALSGTTRGFLGDVVLGAIHIITGFGKKAAADLAASEIGKHVDGQVVAGVYELDADSLTALKDSGKLRKRIPAAANGKPTLVLLHGTFSDTPGTFSKLWTEHPDRVRTLFAKYDKVYGLDHPTLSVSPITNVRTLVDALPDGARLHLVSHSRGGLVAEVMARVCAGKVEMFDSFSDPAYASQKSDLRSLVAEVKKRGITVERVVRVACPARGTLLASKRLDAYLSVFKWTLELAHIPIAPTLMDFINEVARRRADPTILPGLAAQVPDSPLVQWLHEADKQIDSQLRVVAGDMEGDSITSWLKTMLSDAFYWTDNDLVVQTRSMYGGTARSAGATFLLDQGAKVSHFNYFSNDRTSEAIVNALVMDTPPGFGVIGPLSWAGETSDGTRAAAEPVADGTTAPTKPAVFVLPGILGSNLKVHDRRVWLGWRTFNGFGDLAYEPGRDDGVMPDGPIEMSYKRLTDFFSRTHEVVPFAYDWRKPIEDEANRFAKAVSAAMTARTDTKQPVRIIAHSMGGVLARTMQLVQPDVWTAMMQHDGARVLMLGTPNGGSWAPMQVLSGDDTFGNVLTAVGAPFRSHGARDVIAQFPGFLQLQAGLLDERMGLGKQETWERLAQLDRDHLARNNIWHSLGIQLDESDWGIPTQAVLTRAIELRKRLDAQTALSEDGVLGKVVLVVGHAAFTPDGYQADDNGFVYLDLPEEGDGRVTAASAAISGVRAWKVDCDHGALPSKQDAFTAYAELLDTGTTAALPAVLTSTRGADTSAAPHVRSRPARTRYRGAPPEHERDVFGQERARTANTAPTGLPLEITIINGDLNFEHHPLFLGHYRSMRLTGTERIIDRLVGGAMATRLKLGGYPDKPGTHLVFSNTSQHPDDPFKLPRPEAVIVAGLGEEGSLRPSDLVDTVRQAVIGWAQRMAERNPPGDPLLTISATLIGSGGTNMTASQSALLIAQGVREANDKLGDDGVQWPRVGHLRLIELYLDRASEAWHALQVQTISAPRQFILAPTIASGAGGLIRPSEAGYRGADYDFITAISQRDTSGQVAITYTLDTKRARTEVRAQSMQMALVSKLVSTASNALNADTRIGRTLFNLLVPVEMEPFLGGTTEMLLELDDSTAGIPWELLDTDAGGSSGQPWAIRAKLLRKLRTETFRDQVVDTSPDANILVVGEPACPAGYPRLVGARNEARAVVKKLLESGCIQKHQVTSLISPDDATQTGPDALTVLNTLQQCPWRVVHIAGHGAPPDFSGPPAVKPGDPEPRLLDPRGVVLSDETFLGSNEIRALRSVPELVFVNCCHLAAQAPQDLLRPYDRSRFAATVAEALINIGVRCVIAAGWAVSDEAASRFAATFYDSLLVGHRRFIDAVADARIEARKLGGNTWAAYQCYGDPDWVFRTGTADAQRPRTSLSTEFGGIASAFGLRIILDAIAVQSQYQHVINEDQRDKLNHLEANYAGVWGDKGNVADAFGRAWAELGDHQKAVEWYAKARAASDGSASIKSTEQLANNMVRGAWADVSALLQQRDDARRAGSPDDAKLVKALAATIGSSRKTIKKAHKLLASLRDMMTNMERESLTGSMYKRLALVEAAANEADAEALAMLDMQRHYQEAERIGRETHPMEFFYPGLNCLAADIAINGGRAGWEGVDAARVDEVRRTLTAKADSDPDFWSVVGAVELRIYQLLGRRALAGEREAFEEEFSALHRRMSAARMWGSVFDTAQQVLTKYASRAGGAEGEAALALLEHLRTLTCASVD